MLKDLCTAVYGANAEAAEKYINDRLDTESAKFPIKERRYWRDLLLQGVVYRLQMQRSSDKSVKADYDPDRQVREINIDAAIAFCTPVDLQRLHDLYAHEEAMSKVDVASIERQQAALRGIPDVITTIVSPFNKTDKPKLKN